MTGSLGNDLPHGIVGCELPEPIYPKQGFCCCWSSIVVKVFCQGEHFCCIPTGLHSGYPGGCLKRIVETLFSTRDIFRGTLATKYG